MRVERISQCVPEHADTAEEIGYSLQIQRVGSRLAVNPNYHAYLASNVVQHMTVDAGPFKVGPRLTRPDPNPHSPRHGSGV